MNINILQPLVPHYRTEFFESLKRKVGDVQMHIKAGLENVERFQLENITLKYYNAYKELLS